MGSSVALRRAAVAFSKRSVTLATVVNTIVPSFCLYGEPRQVVHPDFIHVEQLAVRSRPSEWTIRPHLHTDLSHLIVIAKGGGRVIFESDVTDFVAPQLILVPAGTVHSFVWQPESTGVVLTIADPHLAALKDRHPPFVDLFSTAFCVRLDGENCRLVALALEELSDELFGTDICKSAAIEASLLTIMVRAIRLSRPAGEPHAQDPRHSTLVARLRRVIDRRFHLREPVESYARALAVSATTLRNACAQVGVSPTEVRDQRAIIEAQRLLAYTSKPIGEIGYAIGIESPAYFSRFFARNCGCSPDAWRRRINRADHHALIGPSIRNITLAAEA